MRKIKQLPWRKAKQQKEKMAKNTILLLKQYSTRQWLVFIRNQNINYKKFKDINIQLETKPEFLVVYADMALRISKDNDSDFNPTIEQISHLLRTEIELSNGDKNAIKLFGIGGVSFLATWQNRFTYSQINMLGRMNILYKKYNDYMIEKIHLSIDDIYIILLSILVTYENKQMIYLKKETIENNSIPHLSIDKINNFFKFLSINKDDYIKKSKENKIYDKSFGKFKNLIRYPIIEIESNLFIIPVFEQFIDTISNNLYFLLLENFRNQGKDESKKFLDEFGIILEKYVLELAIKQFGAKKIVDANKIVTNKKEFRCEAVIIYDKKALAIEVKKMYFRRDAIEQMDKEHIDKLLKDIIVKAYQQIENTLKYIKYSNDFGLIVIPDIMIGLSAINGYIKNEFKNFAKFNNNIFICTLSSYEALMANSSKDIFIILENVQKRNRNEGNDINMVLKEMINSKSSIKIINSFLKNESDIIIKKLSIQT